VKKANGVQPTWFDIWDLGKAHARLGWEFKWLYTAVEKRTYSTYRTYRLQCVFGIKAYEGVRLQHFTSVVSLWVSTSPRSEDSTARGDEDRLVTGCNRLRLGDEYKNL
jgi:hypothetical protein